MWFPRKVSGNSDEVLIEVSSGEEELSEANRQTTSSIKPGSALELISEAEMLDVERLAPELWLNDSIINFFCNAFALTLAKS